jgi:hypothetical protein
MILRQRKLETITTIMGSKKKLTYYLLCLFCPLALLAAVPLTELLLGLVSESGGSFRFSVNKFCLRQSRLSGYNMTLT